MSPSLNPLILGTLLRGVRVRALLRVEGLWVVGADLGSMFAQ